MTVQRFIISIVPRWFVGVFSVLTFLSSGAQTSILYPEDIFTELRPLLETAIDSASSLEKKRWVSREREAQSLSADAQNQMRIYLNARMITGYESRTDDVENRSTATVNSNFSVSKPLYYWGALDDIAESRALLKDASDFDYAESLRAHLNQVRKTYMEWSLSRRQLEILDENAVLAAQFVENQRKLFEAGQQSEQSILEMEVRLQSTDEQRAQLDRDIGWLREQLIILVGDEERVDQLEGLSFPEFEMMTETEISELKTALEKIGLSTPMLERESLYAEAEAKYADSIEKRHRPNLDMVAGLFTDRIDAANSSDSAYRFGGYAGVEVRWNIFDGNRDRGERMAAMARKRQREYSKIEAAAYLNGQAERTLAELKYIVRQVQTRTTQVDLLARRLKLAETPEASGLIAPIDLLELRLDYLNAQQAILVSRVDYLINLTNLAAMYYDDPVGGV